MPHEETPPLPIDWEPPGYRFARIPLIALDSIPRGATRDVFNVLMSHYRPGLPIRLTNKSIARQCGCEEGTARRAIAWLKSHLVPDQTFTFILVGGDNGNRVIWIQCRPLGPGEDQSYKKDRARAGAGGARARARPPRRNSKADSR